MTHNAQLKAHTQGSQLPAMSSGYALLDFGGLRRLEQWGPVRLVRPDPRAIGNAVQADAEWERAEARFEGRTGRAHG